MSHIERDVLVIVLCAGAMCFGLGMLAGMFLARRILKRAIAEAGRQGERR